MAIKRARALQWGRFVDKSDSRTHQDQRVKIHWAAELSWNGLEWDGTADALEKR